MKPGSSLRNGEVTLLELIGQGGFGQVFLAEVDGSRVAVKLVDTSSWSQTERQVFSAHLNREKFYLECLDHAALPFYESTISEGPYEGIVMEWLPGPTLHQLVEDDGPLPLEEFLSLTDCLIDVLHYLHCEHTETVVFGDVKPSNVLRPILRSYKLVDLGLVSAQGTALGEPFATFSPNFSAPEKSQAHQSHVRQDIFSFAATLFFALTRVEPEHQMSFHDLEGVLRVSLGMYDADLGAASWHCLQQFLTLVLAGLDPDPGLRPANIEAFESALIRLLETREREQNVDGQDETASGVLYSAG